MSIYLEGPTASIDAIGFHYEATYVETLYSATAINAITVLSLLIKALILVI